MNEYDSARLAQALETTHGLQLTQSPEQADVLLLNTCSVREKPQEKVFSQLGVWREFKRNNPNIIIGVGGCVASQEGESILQRAPYVDLIFGPQTLHRLPQMLTQSLNTKKAQIDVSFPEIEKFDCLPATKATGVSALVSIMEGCSHYCTFCVVPYTRGEEVSRNFVDVLSEIKHLSEQGVVEIHLLGQNVNAYRGLMPDGGTADLSLLIRYIAAMPKIQRIRFTTSHPVEITDELIQVFAEEPKLVSFLHLPVQTGSDKILAQMKRGHTVLEYKNIIKRLRQARPGLSISSDFIIGFPNETDADFQATMDLIAEIGFDHSYSFIYSPRPGTPAAQLADNVDMAVKKQRLLLLQQRINQMAMDISRSMVGSWQKILVEKMAKKPCAITGANLAGRTENNRVVNFVGSTELIGQFVVVEITEALPNSLRGRLIN